ncbi:hypothetical protein TWF106_006722 [Orbilia oligospora]|uniref:Uncharacterized protein n=2 Tax=Orbilia oligospora TaxID=2813651 RepID=A0A7C8QPN8_ORBOL|nr:hypothetical protein TWF191_001805 [Orbilia oligospora]KAF3220396.1 hypothetical protein TWF106_006722 [Orbilia oligospora]
MPPTTGFHTSFAVILHNHTSRIMRRYRYDVRGGISVPPEIINPPKDTSIKAPGTVLVTSDNKDDSTDSDDDLDFLKVGPKAKLVYHWNDEDGTYKVEINYNEKDGFNADLSGPDARKFKIRVNQTGAEHTHLERNDPVSPTKPTHRRTQSSGSSPENKAGNRSSRSFGKNGVKFGKALTDRFKGPDTSKASGVAFLSVTVERTSEEDLRRLQAEDENTREGFPTVVEVDREH